MTAEIRDCGQREVIRYKEAQRKFFGGIIKKDKLNNIKIGDFCS